MREALDVWMQATFFAIQWPIFVYFVGLNIAYFRLLWIAQRALTKRIALYGDPHRWEGCGEREPPITIVAPAYLEEKTVVQSVTTMLQLDYPEFEILVICDGSKDRTFEVLDEAFDLRPYVEPYRARLKAQPLERTCRSAKFPNLRVFYKKNGGKADAINVGINAAQYPLVCVIDTDTLIAPDGLKRLARPFIENPSTVATGGTVRLSNGLSFEGGRLTHGAVPASWLACWQIVEYQRSFIIGRMGWDPFNGTLIISGAFGLFHKETLIEAGGFDHSTIGEDMEVVVRLHRMMREEGRPYRIQYVPEATCWTEAPEDYKSLKGQRIRWHRGLTEVLWRHRAMFFSRRHGVPGMVAMPFYFLYEWLAPVLEVAGYLLLTVAVLMGWVTLHAYLAMTVLALGPAVCITIAALLVDERTLQGYKAPRAMAKLFVAAVTEPFTYRLVTVWWRVIAIHRIMKKKKAVWEAVPRKGFK